MVNYVGLLKAFIAYYRLHHKHNLNQILHIIGISLVFFGIFQLFTGDRKAGLLIFFLGYLCQWIGHTFFEKNELGEVILVKRLIKKLRRRLR